MISSKKERERSSKDFPVKRIQAAVLRRKGVPLKIEDLQLEGPSHDEFLVRILASGICHTDIDFIDEWDGSPAVLGHEGAGIVEQVGAKAKKFRPGDHVVLSYQSCGHCPQCRKGRPAHCEHLWELNFGFQRLDGTNAIYRNGVRGSFFGQSSFATYALATERNAVKVGKDLPPGLLAPLGCGIQTGAGTIMNSLHVSKGESVALFGTGAVGLAAVMAARIVGANPIIGVDINPRRLRLALELGCTHIINNRKEDIAARIHAITGRGVDNVLEITGDPGMYKTGIDILNPHGKMALIATPDGSKNLPGGRKIISIIQGDAVPQRFIPKLIRLHKKGLFPFDRLVRFYDFRRINQAIKDAKSGKTIKPVLLMPP